MRIKKGKHYLIEFAYAHARFKGIVECLYRDSDYTNVKIITTIFANRENWKPGWTFYTIDDAFVREVSPEKNPEYYL
jgi:hypothetical protein